MYIPDKQLLDVSAAKSKPKRGNTVRRPPRGASGELAKDELPSAAPQLEAVETEEQPQRPGLISIQELRDLAQAERLAEMERQRASPPPVTVPEAVVVEKDTTPTGSSGKLRTSPSGHGGRSLRKKKKPKARAKVNLDGTNASSSATAVNDKGDDDEDLEEESSNSDAELTKTPADSLPQTLASDNIGDNATSSSLPPAVKKTTAKKKAPRKKKASTPRGHVVTQSQVDEANARADEEKKLRLATDALLSKILARSTDDALQDAISKWQAAEEKCRNLTTELHRVKSRK